MITMHLRPPHLAEQVQHHHSPFRDTLLAPGPRIGRPLIYAGKPGKVLDRHPLTQHALVKFSSRQRTALCGTH